jgi:hypothetical protein
MRGSTNKSEKQENMKGGTVAAATPQRVVAGSIHLPVFLMDLHG